MSWENKHVVVIGDSRVEDLKNTGTCWKPKNCIYHSKPGMKIEEALKKVDEVLDSNVLSEDNPIDVMIIMCLHCELTQLKNWKDTGCTIMIPNKEINISNLITNIKTKLMDWKESHPQCQIILTVPYVPNFGRYNSCRLYRKLEPDQVKIVYPYRYSNSFITQMKTLIDQFFQVWDTQLSPRPLALARMEYINNAFRRNIKRSTIQSFQGSTRDGVHFVGATVAKCWKLIKLHHDYLNKRPGKAYRIKDESTPRNVSLENRMQHLSVTPGRDRREHQQNHQTRNPRSFRKQPRYRYNIHRRDTGRNFDSGAGPSGIQSREIRADEDLRNKIENRSQQNSHLNTQRILSVETRSFYRKIVRRF
ncbi:UNVERIFIED_CONTAM: hypothetical protein RMT77_017122 [Armadillidium vulgare]